MIVNTVPASAQALLPCTGRGTHRRVHADCAGLERRSLEEDSFRLLELAFHRHGGLPTGEEVCRRMRGLVDQPLSVVARWIVAGKILSIDLHGQTFIPAFQFEHPEFGVRRDVEMALDELRAVYDDWELLLWFARPNAWLDAQAPVDALNADDEAVFRAARADRFVARG